MPTSEHFTLIAIPHVVCQEQLSSWREEVYFRYRPLSIRNATVASHEICLRKGKLSHRTLAYHEGVDPQKRQLATWLGSIGDCVLPLIFN